MNMHNQALVKIFNDVIDNESCRVANDWALATVNPDLSKVIQAALTDLNDSAARISGNPDWDDIANSITSRDVTSDCRKIIGVALTLMINKNVSDSADALERALAQVHRGVDVIDKSF